MQLHRHLPDRSMTPSEILQKHEDANEMHFHEVDRKFIIEAMEEYAQQKLQELNTLIGSDSVYTLLRGAHKRPSMMGVDDCEDKMYYDLYVHCCNLRKK